MSEKKRICIDKKRADFLDIDTFSYLSSFFATADVVISLLLTCKQVRQYLLLGKEVCKNVEFVFDTSYHENFLKEAKRRNYKQQGNENNSVWTTEVFIAHYPYVKKLRFTNVDHKLHFNEIVSKFPFLSSLSVTGVPNVSFEVKVPGERRSHVALKELKIHTRLRKYVNIRRFKDLMPSLERIEVVNCRLLSSFSWKECPFAGLKNLKDLVVRNEGGRYTGQIRNILSLDQRMSPSSLLDLPALETLDVRRTTWFIDMLKTAVGSIEQLAVVVKLKSLKSILVCCSNPIIDVDKMTTDLKKERGLYYCPKCEQKCKKCRKQIFDLSENSKCKGCEQFCCKACSGSVCDCCKDIYCESCCEDDEIMEGCGEYTCSNKFDNDTSDLINSLQCPYTVKKTRRWVENGHLYESSSFEREYFLCCDCEPLDEEVEDPIVCCCCEEDIQNVCYSCLVDCDNCDRGRVLCIRCAAAGLDCSDAAFDKECEDMEDRDGWYRSYCYSCHADLPEEAEEAEEKEEAEEVEGEDEEEEEVKKSPFECVRCEEMFCEKCRGTCIHCKNTVCEDEVCSFFCSASPECSKLLDLPLPEGNCEVPRVWECVECVGNKFVECKGKKCKRNTNHTSLWRGPRIRSGRHEVVDTAKWHLGCKSVGLNECGKCKESLCVECFGDRRCKVCQKSTLPCSGCCQKQVKCVECNFPICDNCKEISVFKLKPDLSVNVCKECSYWAPPPPKQ